MFPASLIYKVWPKFTFKIIVLYHFAGRISLNVSDMLDISMCSHSDFMEIFVF